MRVLIAVAHGGIYSGGAHQALYQLAGFRDAGIDTMAIWGPDEEDDPHGFDRLKSLDIPFEIIPINKTLTTGTLRQFRNILKSFKPDVVECFKSGAQYHALFGGVGLNKHALIFYRGISRRMDYWQGWKYRLKRVDRIIANCEDLKWIMSETGKIPAEKIDFVHGQFDPAFNDPDIVDVSNFREELGIPEDLRLITQLGNFSPWRGQHITLEAASVLKGRGYRFHLLFAGRQTDKLKEQVDKLQLSDIVTLSPYRRDPERVVKASDILVNASISHESLPGSLVNTIAMGRPAVATSVPGVGMIVRDGVNGFMIKPGDTDALSQALAKMLDLSVDELNSMGAASRRIAEEEFTSEIRTARRLKVYERALRHRKGLLNNH